MKRFILALTGAVIISLGTSYADRIYAEENSVHEENLSGWVQEGGKWYYYDEETGQMVTGWLKDNDKWYYLDRSGVMVTGWTNIDLKAYYFHKNGVMQTGWLYNDGKWHYFNQHGTQQTGWVFVDGKWYYLDATDMVTGWYKDNGKWYYMNKQGVMQTGWLLDSGKWYYLDKHGAMATGWINVNGKYFMDQSGAMVTGWKWIDQQWHHFENSGLASSGWRFLSKNWYYFDSSLMVKQQLVDGYYLAADGIMSTAGSKEIVNVVESLKKSILPEMSKSSLKQKLGSNYHQFNGQHGDFWVYSLLVTKPGQYSVIDYTEGDNSYENLAKGKVSIVVTVYWNDDKSYKVDILYFDENHKGHIYTHLKADQQYN